MLSKTLTALILALLAAPASAITIFACQPDWAALAKAHAPDATIYSATTAFQDPHYIQARPSLISKMRKADLVLCSGAELEIGWLPEIFRQSRNGAAADPERGLLYIAMLIPLLDKPAKVDRAMGDVHAHGNPHVQFAIDDMPLFSEKLAERLVQLDPDNAAQYQKNGIVFRVKWGQKQREWREKAAPLAGKQVVAYHATYRYLFEWLGIEQVADLEPKPGISPTTSHLNTLTKLNTDDIYAIVYSTHQTSNAADWLGKKTGLPQLVLPQSVGGSERAQDLFTLIDDSIDKLLEPME
ncbi:metal ABC transporter solute-binding protein, Zn/Mn family [Thaumasiovibrio subtropicus]|uniref:metal ABC transporter solute-binding protein, Zn/Mn family n=1 Tax=Thaumasiovibrio subtropicus TaxID=1891207 RepID=UPI000B34D248|nr:zinc ABC transporter substrate-binding protein [Thaumasiovibrio subtropicus]